jgi:hypothetical protein
VGRLVAVVLAGAFAGIPLAHPPPAPTYPQGGIMGDHVIVLWNRERHGYFVSLHFERYSRHAREAAALAIADSF